ncbi:MAG: hypothetical protein Q4C70_05420 [Planctomycetia bacterium]|nr:hypothetical protein [Planctomycetia bacterium]
MNDFSEEKLTETGFQKRTLTENTLDNTDWAQVERELDAELENSVVWECFGVLLTEAHASVYTAPVDFERETEMAEALTRTKTRKQQETLMQGKRRVFRTWRRAYLCFSGTASLVLLIFGLMIWNSDTKMGTESEIGGKTGQKTVESLASELAFLSELETVSLGKDMENSEYDWEAGEMELVACDEFLEQLAYEDRSLDWEIAILDTSLSDLATETGGTSENTDVDEENWF